MKIEVNTHSKNMVRFAQEHKNAVVLSADLGTSCEVKEFHHMIPDRYFSMGIAEQNMVQLGCRSRARRIPPLSAYFRSLPVSARA